MLIVSTTRGKYRLIAQRNGREKAVQADAGQIRDWVQSEFEPPYPARIRLTTAGGSITAPPHHAGFGEAIPTT